MTSIRIRAVIAIAAAAITLVGLTSCAPAVGKQHAAGGTHGSSAAPGTPISTPTVSTLNLTPPTPLVNINCSKLVSSAQLVAAFGTKHVAAVATNAIATGDLEAQDTQIPAMDYVREAGGVACLWTDKPSNYYTSSFPTESAEQVGFLFNAQTAWQNQTKVGGYPGDINDGSCDLGSCELDQLFGGTTWVNATELNQKGTLSDPFEAILDAAKAGVVGAGSIGAKPTPEAGTIPLGSTCTAFIADASASQALGGTAVVSSQPLLPKDDFSYYGIWSGAQDELGDHPCIWKRGSAAVGHLSWLPGGAWAWNEAKALPLKDGSVAPLAVVGLAAGDTAFIRCAAADASCVADLVIGGNWIEAQVGQPGSTNRAAVTAIATAIVTKLA
jgi:hypothetical protein